MCFALIQYRQYMLAFRKIKLGCICHMLFRRYLYNTTPPAAFSKKENTSHRILWSWSVDSRCTSAGWWSGFVSSQAFKTTRHVFKKPVVLILDLSGQHTKEDEDKHPLKSVTEGEQISGECGLMEDVQHSERPSGTEDKKQGQSTASTRSDVFIVADFRLFHSSVLVHFVHDYSKGQEINQNDETRRSNETPNEVVFCA